MSIGGKAMLVETSIGVWSGQKLDRTSTDKVTADNGASRSAARVTKNLMAGTGKRKEISDFAAACRTWHTNRTLPWADRGARLIPVSLFFEYKDEMDKRKVKFDALVDEFIQEYPNLVEAARANLGSLFDEADYPPVDTLRSKFAFRVVFMPVPEAGDFRVDVEKEDLEDLKRHYEEAAQERVTEAMEEAWSKLHATLTHMSDKLSEPEGDKVKRYHETLLDNAVDLCQLLQHFNLTNDPVLDKARKELESVLAGLDIIDIRENPETRASAKEKIEEVLGNYW